MYYNILLSFTSLDAQELERYSTRLSDYGRSSIGNRIVEHVGNMSTVGPQKKTYNWIPYNQNNEYTLHRVPWYTYICVYTRLHHHTTKKIF